MNICDKSDHGEIVYEGSRCPACRAIVDLIEQNKDLQDVVDNLKGQVNDLEIELERIERG